MNHSLDGPDRSKRSLVFAVARHPYMYAGFNRSLRAKPSMDLLQRIKQGEPHPLTKKNHFAWMCTHQQAIPMGMVRHVFWYPTMCVVTRYTSLEGHLVQR